MPRSRPNCTLSFRFWWFPGLRGFAWLWRCAARGSAAGKIFFGGRQYLRFSERIWMIGELFAQRRNLLSCHPAGVVPPLTALVCKDVGNFLISQCFIPRLHHSRTEFLALNGDRACQTFENDHRRAP